MNAAIYLRVSSDGQARGSGFGAYGADKENEKYSLADQRAGCLAYAEKNGYTVLEEYVDTKSGAGIRNRPALMKLRQDWEQGIYDAVIVYVLDRFSRGGSMDEGRLRSEAMDYGCRVLSATEEHLNGDDVFAEMLRGNVSSFAKYERIKIAERTGRGKANRIASGKYPSGRDSPFGYEFGDAKKTFLVINEEEAETVRFVFTNIARGESLRGIAKSLNARGIYTGRGNKWEAKTVKLLVEHCVYKGEVYAKKTSYKPNRLTGKTDAKKRDKSEWIKVDYESPKIVTPELWQKANEAMHDRSKPRKRTEMSNHGLLLDNHRQAVCAKCGRLMARRLFKDQRTPGKVRLRPIYVHEHNAADRFGCKGFTLPGHSVDDAVWKAAVDVITRPDVLDSKLLAFSSADPTEMERRSLSRFIAERREEHAKQSKTLLKLADALDEYTLASYTTQLRELAATIQQAEHDLAYYQQQYEAWRASQRNLDDVRGMIEAVREDMRVVLNEETPLDVRRALVTLLGVQVKMYPKSHEPRWEMTMTFGAGGEQRQEDGMIQVPLTSSTACRPAPSGLAPSPAPAGVARTPS